MLLLSKFEKWRETPFPSSVFPSLKLYKKKKGFDCGRSCLYEKDCGNGVRFLRVPIEACSKMRGAGKSSPDKAGGTGLADAEAASTG